MPQNVHIFVEGEEDEYFLKSYINYLNCYRSGLEIKYVNVKGWTLLEGQCPDIEKNLDNGERVLIVFDADKSYRKRRSEIEKILRTKPTREISTQNSDLDIFLFPNNRKSGKIENLLKEIVMPEHKKIFDCFQSYKECLKGKDASYQLPDIKGKIYSYKEALGVVKKKGESRFSPEYWDFQNSFLVPLKNFLLEGLS